MPQVAVLFPVTFAAAGTKITAGMIVTQLLSSVALSALSQALLAPDAPRQPGIATEVTTQGGTNPQSFVLGRYATAGNEVAPPMSHGETDGTPNAYLTYVHDLGDMAFFALNRLIVNDAYVPLSGTAHPDYGTPMAGDIPAGAGWAKIYDGTQTAADAMLVAKYATYPDRPWSTDMIGRGVPYAILTFRYNREVWNALPRVSYEVDGIALYDPRLDTSVGGSGAHRWGQLGTYEFTRNPVVMIYNILRGIELPDGRVWGGEASALDLPVANWIAAMNVCDEAVTLAAGGTEPRYRAGLEVRVTEEPAAVIEELLKSCSGQIVESGGVYRIRAGGVGLPVLSITDGDIIVTEAQSFLPFAPLGETYNGLHASYPEPDAFYSATDAPPVTNATYEAEDQGRQLVADLSLSAVPYGLQVQRLTDAWIKEERRLRRHRLTLPPRAAKLEPLDAIAWTSAANGYTAKVFEVSAAADSFLTLNQTLMIRERDSDDYAWDVADERSVVVPDFGLVAPPAQSVVGLSVTAVAIEDATGTSRRPAIRIGWTTANIDDVDGVQIEVRVAATEEIVAQFQALDFAAGSVVTEAGLVGSTEYQVRARYIVSGTRAVSWSSWTSITTSGVFLQNADFAGGVYRLFTDQGLYAIRDVTALPASGAFTGEKVFNRTDGKLYQWTGSAWVLVVAQVNAPDINGHLVTNQIAVNAVTSELIASGAVISSKLGNLAVTAEKVASSAITSAKIAAGAVQEGNIASNAVTAIKVATSAITETKIASDAVTTPKIAAGAVTANEIAAAAITAGKIAAGAVTAAEIAAGTITSAQIATDTITATNIAAGAINASELNTNAVTADKIAANAVTAAKISAGAVTAEKIAANTITASEIAANTITGNEIAGNTITASEIAGNTITADKIAANTITGGLLATSGIITQSAQIGDALITNAKIANAAVTAAKIGDAEIETAKIADLAVETLKIKGNAVSVIRAASSSTAYSGSSWSTRVSLTFTPALSDGQIAAWARSLVIVTSNSDNTRRAEYEIRLLWKGVDMADGSAVIDLSVGGSSTPETRRGALLDLGLADAGAGSGTLELQARRVSGAGLGSDSIDDFVLVVAEYKR